MKRFWFLLVDASGNLLSDDGTAAEAREQEAIESALLSDDALVHDLRDAVKLKRLNTLAHVDADELRVYENRVASKPLLPFASLKGRGFDQSHALAVRVPARAQQNMERSAKTQRAEEAPDVWMKMLEDEQVDVLPSDREALVLHLERELREKIPISKAFVQEIVAKDKKGRCIATRQKLFVEQEHGISPQTTYLVWGIIEADNIYSQEATEATYISFWDMLIARVLQRVSSGTFRRNTNTASSLYRPNLCFYYDKRDTPIDGLYKNLIWRYGDAPYVFGCAAVGCQVCLVLIQSDNPKQRTAKAEVIQHYDLSELHGRLSFFLALLNLTTLFRPVVKLIKPLGFPENGTIARPNGVRISFAEDKVMKEYPSTIQSAGIIRNLNALHSLMKAHSVPNVVELKASNLRKRRVILAPIGLVGPPSNVNQLVTALQDILRALVALHKLGFMHRDLRWDNVLQHQHDPNHWFLIDFDEATMSPANAALHLNQGSHAPEITSLHTVKVDIWGVGHLLRTANVRDHPPQLAKIQKQCLRENPKTRPTAASLLRAVQTISVLP